MRGYRVEYLNYPPQPRIQNVPNKSKAMILAQMWCDENGMAANIVRRRDEKLIMRYWYDSEGLQYMEY